ncbi:MAG: nucleotidyltransferase family protein [Vampirovibrionales bacterium]
MLTKEYVQQQLKVLIPTLLQHYPIESLSLFGSVARNEATEASDIDLLVEFNQPVGWAFFELEEQLAQALNCTVDLVPKTGLKPHYLERIIPDMVEIWHA